MGPERVAFTQEKETLLFALYLRAVDSRAARPILGDRYAEELLGRIDYDFDQLALMRADAPATAVRAKQLDTWTRVFLTEHPDAVVLHLGCGLDSRVLRVDPPRTALWVDLDYPEVIAVRRRLYPDRAGIRTIEASVTDAAWWGEIPADRPTLVLAEGLLMYLHPPDVHTLLDRVTAHLPCGQLAFDAVARWVAVASKIHPLLRRAVLAAMRPIPALRNSMRVLRYQF